MSRKTMTLTAARLLAPLAAALALAACGGGGEGAEVEGAHGAAATSSSAGLPKGRVAEGEALANVKGKATGQSCIDCHGADGNAPIDATYPKLGGQHGDYLAHAMTMYRDSTREHALMGQQAKELTDQQVADLAAYFASRPSQLVDLHGKR